MDVVQAIRSRKSIRRYKPDPVPKRVLEEILEIATRAPSGNNTQPWEIAVVTGAVLETIRRANVEKLSSGAGFNPDLPIMRPFEGVYKQRQVELAVQLFQIMGIAREDKEKRAQWMERGFRFFDAPAAIIISVDKSLDVAPSAFDIGALCQTICLVALNYGLGTCIEAQGVAYNDVIRKYIGIPESKNIIIGIAIGYPDWEFPANKVESKREPLENVVTWHGF